MANGDYPKGLVPFGEVLRVTKYEKDASAGAIGIGTLVKMEADGCIAPAGTTDSKILGVSAKYSAASTADTECPVYDHPDQRFVIQDDASATLAQTAVGANADSTTETVNTTTGLSIVELDASGVTASAAQLRIVEVAPTIYPDGTVNAVGDNCDWIVTINEHAYGQTAGI